jgi:Phage terminase large subunit
LIIADSAEPRLIDDLKRKGLNIQGCVKGQGSVSAGISKMQDYKIVITPTSSNIRKELSNYVWNDKKAGIPVDAFNHLIDAIRYAFDYLARPKHSTVLKKNSLI